MKIGLDSSNTFYLHSNVASREPQRESSVEARTFPRLSEPPVIKTCPDFRRVAEWPIRSVRRLPVSVDVPVAGSKISALASTMRLGRPSSS